MSGSYLILDNGLPPTAIASEYSTPRAVDFSNALSLINEALINTGNRKLLAGDDGSDEWDAGWTIYNQAFPELLYRRDWPFATRISSLARLGDSLYPGFADVFSKPADCLYLRYVYRADLAALVTPAFANGFNAGQTRPPPLEYRIIGDDIHCVAPQGAMAIYIPLSEAATPVSVGFRAVLRLMVEAGLYRSLNGDNTSATYAEKRAEMALAEAFSRAENEEPKRALIVSTLARSRRVRRGGAF